MPRRSEMPVFGNLQGLRVVHCSTSVAGPIAAQMMADAGADVIWIENFKSPDFNRTGTGMSVQQDRRNQRNIGLNIPSPEGKKVFLDLMKETDIFIESSRGGQYKKWGLTDEVLWEANPALIIVHISGFGQTGVPEYVTRASYDPIAQAFGCYTFLNGFIDRPPISAYPVPADYITGMFGAFGALAALYRTRQTGIGESIDCAQFESIIRCEWGFPMEYLNLGLQKNREGNKSEVYAGYGSYKCMDGEYIYILVLGANVTKAMFNILGLEMGNDIFPANLSSVLATDVGAPVLEAALQDYFDHHTAEDAEKELLAAGVACSRIMNYAAAVKDPHYIAREVFVEWEEPVEHRKLKGIGVFPKYKNNPGKVWRGMPGVGMDNKDILLDLGYSEERIEELKECGAIGEVVKKWETVF